MDDATLTIPAEDRTLAALTHLSGLAGYIVPLGGVLVPIVIWMVNRDSPMITGIAKQALLLNLAAFVLVATAIVLIITIILIPLVILFCVCLGIAVVVLPIVGALKAHNGVYYRYPFVGITPAA
jgi:uncharacterized Tic20 family protein